MEPEISILGAILGAVTGLVSPDGGAGATYRPQPDVPAEYRPLQIATEGYSYDMRPTELREVSLIFSDGPALAIEFGPNAASWIAVRTTQAVGEYLWIHVCGEEVMVPIILEPILNGQVTITGDFTVSQLRDVAELITGQSVCDMGDVIPAGK